MKKILTLLAIWSITLTFASCVPSLNEPITNTNIKGTKWHAKYIGPDNIYIDLTFKSNPSKKDLLGDVRIEANAANYTNTTTEDINYYFTGDSFRDINFWQEDNWLPNGENLPFFAYFSVKKRYYWIEGMTIQVMKPLSNTSTGKLKIWDLGEYAMGSPELYEVEITRIK